MITYCKLCQYEHAFKCKCKDCYIDLNDLAPCPDFTADDSDLEENDFSMLCENCMSYSFLNFDLINDNNYIKKLNNSAKKNTNRI